MPFSREVYAVLWVRVTGRPDDPAAKVLKERSDDAIPSSFAAYGLHCQKGDDSSFFPARCRNTFFQVSKSQGPQTHLLHDLLPREWGRAREALGFFLGAVSAHHNSHTMALSTCKRRKSTEPSSKPSQVQSQVEIVPALQSPASGQKDVVDLPLPRIISYLHQTQTSTPTPLPLEIF